MKTLAAFDFYLPPERIAQHPVTPRDSARLLILARDASPADSTVAGLPQLLKAGDILVVNNSKVIPARLYGMRGQAKVEILLHRKLDATSWETFLRPLKRIRIGDVIEVAPGTAFRLEAVRDGGMAHIRFLGEAEAMMPAIIRHGLMPLPPYIQRGTQGVPEDSERYQTIYARHEGSVAAPTAGLHFTPELLDAIRARGVEIVEVTLHVGAGTFQPVRVENIEEHVMHAEVAEIGAEVAARLNAARAAGGRIVAVGTTATRVLETATDEAGQVHAFNGETRIFITPGTRFKAVDALLTNFHLPKSTLFMLVCALGGVAKVKQAYDHAIRSGYRFYSYGDACWIENAN
jgi:S-adenosylmethionine:tRNA ribosyltransferase-isomerase